MSCSYALVGYVDHFELWSFFPDPARPGQSRTEIKFLLPGHVTSDEDREFLMRNVAILTQALDDEDMPMSREIQDNLDRSGTTTVIFGRNEPMDQRAPRTERGDGGPRGEAVTTCPQATATAALVRSAPRWRPPTTPLRSAPSS